MNDTYLKNACAALDGALQKVYEVLRDIEKNTIAGIYGDPDETASKDDDERLEYYLQRSCGMMATILDGLDLDSTRRLLLRDWARFVQTGLNETRFLPEFDVVTSEPLSYLSHLLDGLKSFLQTEETAIDAYQEERLIEILRDTAVLVQRRKVEPQGEYDIQHVMHDYLGVVFTEFVTNITIPGTLKGFKPDCGVRNLRIAIEFKYANSKDEVVKALSGVYEDISGYSGSQDWTRFISVVYMTEPFESESKFKADLRRAGAVSWTPILVNGSGTRRKRKDRGAGDAAPVPQPTELRESPGPDGEKQAEHAAAPDGRAEPGRG